MIKVYTNLNLDGKQLHF